MTWTRRTLGVAGVPLAILLLASTAQTWQWAEQTTERQALDSLNRQWAAMKGYLRIEGLRPSDRTSVQWYYDVDDPDESAGRLTTWHWPSPSPATRARPAGSPER